MDPARALEQRRQVAVYVAGIAPASGQFLPGGGDLAQRLAVVGHVGHHDQDLQAGVPRKVLGGGQREPRGLHTLDGRVLGEVEEGDHAVLAAAAGEGGPVELGFAAGDPERGDHDEVILAGLAGHRAVAEPRGRRRPAGGGRRTSGPAGRGRPPGGK